MPELLSFEEQPKAFGPLPPGAIEVRKGVISTLPTIQEKVQSVYNKYQAKSSSLLKQWTTLEDQYKLLQEPIHPISEANLPSKFTWLGRVKDVTGVQKDVAGAYIVGGQRYSAIIPGSPGAPLPETQKSKQLMTQMKVQMDSIASERNKAMFFSNALDMASDADILGSHLDMTAEELIALAGTPPSMTKEEMDELREVVQTQLDFLMGRLPEMAKEVEKTTLEKLVAPLPEPKPIGMIAMTVEAIKQSLSAPRVPDQIMTDKEWQEHLEAEVAVDPDMKSRADQKIKEWQDITSQLEANRQGIAELPTWKFWDYVREAVVTPGLALGETFMFYAEHVSQPLAGMLWKTMIPDIESAYQQYRKEGSTYREALVQAWQGWEAPGAGNWTPDWILKYILMEGLVDPLTSVGWGIFTKITKPLGAFGRYVGAAEKGLSELFELPFDAVKGIWNKLPKSIPQQALLVRARTGQYFKKALELDLLKQAEITGGAIKTFRQATNQDLAGFIDRAIKHYNLHPGSEDALAQAGRDLLLHKTFSQEQVVALAKSLKSSFADDITSRNILKVNDIFEDFFTKVGNVDVAAGRLVKVLDGSGKTTVKDATSWLTKQADNIVKEAQSYATYAKPVKGQLALMERNYRYTEDILKSVAARERMKLGRVASLFDQVTSTSSRIWANTIDRFVTRPFAIAYLTFGMYGPMNTVEDIIRSALGGVMPGTKSSEFFELKWARTLYDPDLTLRKGISEMYGVARELADDVTRNSWVITLSTAGLSLPTYGVTGLVGKAITPEQFARGTRFALNEFWNRIGADIRRNFVDRKATQILLSSGGDEIKQLVKAISRFEGTSSKSLNKEVTRAVEALALTGEPDAIRSVTGMFTHKKIQEKQVRQIIEKFTELPPETRNSLITKLRNGELFNETPIEGVKFPVARRIDDTFALEADALKTSILKDPDLASKEIEALTDLYVQAGIRSPEEMAQAMTSLHMVGNTYDMTSKEVLARASRYSRGLPFDERNPWINKAMDDVARFKQDAGNSIDRLVDTIKTNMTKADVTPEYVVAGNHLLDLRTAKRVKVADLNQDFNEWRRGYFVGATKDRLKSSSFWDEFYNQVDNWISRLDSEAITYDTMIDAASKAVNRASGYAPPPRQPVIVKGRALAPADVALLLEVQGDDLSRAILDLMTIQHDRNRFVAYVMAQVDKDVGFTPESVGKVYDQLVSGIVGNQRTVDMLTARELQLDALRKEMHQYYNARTIKPEDIDAIGKYVDQMADNVDKVVYEKGGTYEMTYPTKEIADTKIEILTRQGHKVKIVESGAKGIRVEVTPKSEIVPKVRKTSFQEYDDLRQSAMDEAHKWYYKEYTDYTHANVIDDMMKYIYPFWQYESGRWQYLPRALVKHPVVFTTLGKYINESDNGYVHIPNTNIDINPFRGTVFGTLTGSLTRRDYKSYYDSLPLGQFVEYNDFLSRYGFYPGAPWNLIQSALGGVESQFGEALPSTAKSLLDIAVATFPDNKAMNFISQKLFSDRFRDYLTLKEVTRRGGDGALIGRKQRGKEKLTEEEQQLWNDSRSQVSWYSAGFEQFGLFRMRPEEQIQIQQACSQAIFEMTGFTADQQDWMRDHGIRVWDQVGGMSPSQQAILEALGYWKYSGLSGELMPGSEQAIQDRISQDWDSVINYNQSIIMQGQLELQRDFLNGIVGPDDYNARLKELYTQKQTYIDNKVSENPLMLLENRADYYKQYGIVQPVMHPQKELLALYFSIELKETTNPDTGEKMVDWDSFYAERDAIDAAIPDEYRQEWDAVIAKNQTRVEGIRRTVYDTYFTKYNGVWDSILKRYSPEEQRLISEYLSLERLGRDLGRQDVIRNIIDSKGRQLISGFRSDVSSAKEALRFANPSLDAWLFYWGKTSSFQTPQAELAYNQIVKDTGRAP